MSDAELIRQLSSYWRSIEADLPELDLVPMLQAAPPDARTRTRSVALVPAVAILVMMVALLAAGVLQLFGGERFDPADPGPLVLPVERVPAVVFDGSSCQYFGGGQFEVGEPRVFTMVNSSEVRVDIEVFETTTWMTADHFARTPGPWPQIGFFYRVSLAGGEAVELDASPPSGRDVAGRWAILCVDDDHAGRVGTLFDVVDP